LIYPHKNKTKNHREDGFVDKKRRLAQDVPGDFDY